MTPDAILSTLDRCGQAEPGKEWAPIRPSAASEAAKLIRELLAARDAGAFELFDHLNAPSRRNPFAAAAAVNLTKRSIL